MYAREKAEKAKKFLKHYIRLCYEKAGGRWDREMDLDLDELIDAIIEASIETIREER